MMNITYSTTISQLTAPNTNATLELRNDHPDERVSFRSVPHWSLERYRVMVYEKVDHIQLTPHEFEKTPKKSIKRYLYS